MRGKEGDRVGAWKAEEAAPGTLVCVWGSKGLSFLLLWPLVPTTGETQKGGLRCAFEARRLPVISG